jgi:hypothetical protein
MDNDPREGRGAIAWPTWIAVAIVAAGCLYLLAACVLIGPITVDRKIGVEGNINEEKEKAPEGAPKVKPAT